MTITFKGKATAKIRNGGFLRVFNRTTSRDLKESLKLPEGKEKAVTLGGPFPVVLRASSQDGAVAFDVYALGFPVFHQEILRPGDSLPINWSWNGSSLTGDVSVSA